MIYGDFEYKEIELGIEIVRYNGYDFSLKIPKYINDLPVVSIGESAFLSCNSLTNIVIPNPITKIDKYAFSRCKSLTNITISNSVTKIGKYAFSFCDKLTNIVIPDSITEIDNDAFYRCGSLIKIEFPSIHEDTYSIRYFLSEYKNRIFYYIDPFKRIKNLVALLNSLSAVSKVNWQ